MHAKEITQGTERSFCLSKLNNKSLHSLHSSSQNKSQFMAIRKRQNPKKNIFDVEIKKRKRHPTKRVSQ